MRSTFSCILHFYHAFLFGWIIFLQPNLTSQRFDRLIVGNRRRMSFNSGPDWMGREGWPMIRMETTHWAALEDV